MINIKGPGDSFEESGKHLPENRKAKRLQHKGTIMLCDESSEYYSYAQVINVSGDGMYHLSPIMDSSREKELTSGSITRLSKLLPTIIVPLFNGANRCHK